MKSLRRLGVLSLLAGVASTATPAAAQTFQFGRNATGTTQRPVMVILSNFSDMPFGSSATGPRDAGFFSRLFAGPAFPNVRDWFLEASGGSFTYMPIGVLGPITFPNDPATTADESRYNCWKGLLDNAGREVCPGSSRDDASQISEIIRLAATRYNIGSFDKNGDNIVDPSELTLVVVTSGDNGGKARWGCGPLPGGKQYCGGIQFFGESANFATVAHEMVHAFNGSDLYGPWGGPVRTNNRLTIMGATISGTDERWSVLPEAWNRIREGWVRPRMVSPNTGGCFLLDAASKGGSKAGPDRAPIAIPINGNDRDYFLIEHRMRTGYDQDVGGEGVLVWYVKNDADGNPLNVPYSLFLKPRQTSLSAQAVGDDISIGGPAIVWGANHQLESSAGANDDVGKANWVLAAAPVPKKMGGTIQYATGAYGSGGFFARLHGRVPLVKDDGNFAGLSMDLGEVKDGTVPIRLTPASGATPPGAAACLAATETQSTQPAAVLTNPGCVEYAPRWGSTDVAPGTQAGGAQQMGWVKVSFAQPVPAPVMLRASSSNPQVRIFREITVQKGRQEINLVVDLLPGGLPDPTATFTVVVDYGGGNTATRTTAMRFTPNTPLTRCSAASALEAAGPSLAALNAMVRPRVALPNTPPMVVSPNGLLVPARVVPLPVVPPKLVPIAPPKGLPKKPF